MTYEDLIPYQGEIAGHEPFESDGGVLQMQLPLPITLLEDLGMVRTKK